MHLRTPIHAIKIRFTLHEAWALKTARDHPLFAPFAMGSLGVWVFIPMIPIGILTIYLLQTAGTFGAVANLVLGIGGLAIIAPWFFRWGLICAGLMLGRPKMAQKKEVEISARLERLQG